MMPALTTIYMARMPMGGTVANTALQHGTGSLNIKGTRLGTQDNLNGGAYSDGGRGLLPGDNREGAAAGMYREGGGRLPGQFQQPQGRWPANVILQHKPGCRVVGSHVDEFDINVYGDASTGNFASYKDGDDQRPDYEVEGSGQVVDEWSCIEGCPSLDVERQAEGASRYFKQVQTEDDLREYLRVMASTPESEALVAWTDRPSDLEGLPDSSITGLVLYGSKTLTREQMEACQKVLVPGAHLFIIAPDSQPTGHSAAILLEDAGFEIRDCILWVRDAGRFHYVAKAARSEREAGCGHLEGKSGHDAVDRKEGSAGVNNPRAGAGRTAKHVKNHHPTVKPIEIMERLLADVPTDKHVVDPFLGSGTTGIACARTGHAFTGIEREPEFLAIADARVRYWDAAHHGWLGAEILSDHKPPDNGGCSLLNLDDLFG